MASGKEFKAIISIAGNIDPSLGKAIADVSKQMSGIQPALSKAAGVAGAAFKTVAAVGVTAFAATSAAAIKFGTDAVQAASSYEQAFANASTLMSGTESELQAMSDDILKVSSEYGVAAEQIASSVYSALSAGIDQADAVEFAGKSAKLAAAGFTDVDTALTAVAKTLNAYNMDASETDRIQKVLIQTQNLGITTVDELGQNLAKVTPTAAAFGVSFEEVGAALAGMTAQGTPTAQATTQLNSLIAELGKQGTTASKSLQSAAKNTEYAGMSFAQMKDAGVDLGTIIGMIEEQANKSGKSMVDMFSSIEAGKAALAISGSDFTGNLEAMATSADVVGEAYEKVAGTYEHQLAVIKEQWQNFKIQAGEAILPYLEDIMSSALPVVQDLMGQLMPVIQSVISNVLPPLTSLAQTLIPMISSGIQVMAPFVSQIMSYVASSLPDVCGLIENIAGSMSSTLGPAIESILPVAQELIGAIFSNLPTVIGWITEIAGAIMSVAGPIVSSLLPILTQLFDLIVPIINSLIGTLLPPLVTLVESLVPVVTAILQAVMPMIEMIASFLPVVIQLIASIISALQPLIDMISAILVPAIQAVLPTFQEVFTAVEGVLQGIIDYITGVFTGNWELAWTGIVEFFGNAWSALAGLVKAPLNAVIALVNGAIDAINSLSVTIPAWVPMYGGQTFSLNVPKIPMLAKGGFTQGLSIAGEAGQEAVISFDPSARKENLSYWAKAGKLLGVNATAVDTITSSAKSTGSGGGNFITFSPNVTIQGNADYDTVLQALRDNEEEFMDMVEEFFTRKGKLSYG